MTIQLPKLSTLPINSAIYAAKPAPPTSTALHEDIESILIDTATIQQRVQELGAVINEVYRGQELLLVSVLKGSLLFMADLMRAIEIPHEVDFMAISSYGAGVTSSGVVRIMKDLNFSIEGRNIVIV
jgi:hypoxanthine phosphoribosyltransferase